MSTDAPAAQSEQSPEAQGTQVEPAQAPGAEATQDPQTSGGAPEQGTQESAPKPASQSEQEVVEKARYDGLMRKVNELTEKLSAKDSELREYRKKVLSPEELESATARELQEHIQELQGELQLTKLENAKKEVLSKYPQLKEFEDLIYAEDPEELESLAEDLAARIARLSPGQQTPEQFQAEGSQPQTTVANQDAGQTGGSDNPAPAPKVLPGAPGYVGSGAEDWKEQARKDVAQYKQGTFRGVLDRLFQEQSQRAPENMS